MSYQDDENLPPAFDEEEDLEEEGDALLDPLDDDGLDTLVDDEEGFEEEFAADETDAI